LDFLQPLLDHDEFHALGVFGGPRFVFPPPEFFLPILVQVWVRLLVGEIPKVTITDRSEPVFLVGEKLGENPADNFPMNKLLVLLGDRELGGVE